MNLGWESEHQWDTPQRCKQGNTYEGKYHEKASLLLIRGFHSVNRKATITPGVPHCYGALHG